MEDFDILNKFDNDKLIDVVKNYKRYGYDDEIRDYAINLLKERGCLQEFADCCLHFGDKSLHAGACLSAICFYGISKCMQILSGIRGKGRSRILL